jgi:hypothetical protein
VITAMEIAFRQRKLVLQTMRSNTLLPRWLLLAAALLCGSHLSLAVADDTYVASVEESLANARKHYARGDFRAAFNNFYWAAIRDQPQAQQMVGLMYLLGPEAFGTNVKRDRDEAAFWMNQAQEHGIDVNEHLRCAITRKVSERQVPIAERAWTCLDPTAANRQSSISAGGRVEADRIHRKAR